jgi:hypothetical protein
MKLKTLVLIASLMTPMSVFAQPVIGRLVSIGIIGGGSLTDAFSSDTAMGVDTFAHDFSPSKDYIVGPTIELHLPLNISVEFDSLYRPLNLTITNMIFPSTLFTTSGTVNSWEFPLLAKYRLPMHPVKPFLEAGPSFRRLQQSAGASCCLSRAGFTAGGGVEFRLGPIKIAPEIRYTRWGSDSNLSSSILNPDFNVNQAEGLVGLSF